MSDNLPSATVSNGQSLSAQIIVSLATIETKYPGDSDILTLHKQLNTAAVLVARSLSQPDSTFSGSPGYYDVNSGGTNKRPNTL